MPSPSMVLGAVFSVLYLFKCCMVQSERVEKVPAKRLRLALPHPGLTHCSDGCEVGKGATPGSTGSSIANSVVHFSPFYFCATGRRCRVYPSFALGSVKQNLAKDQHR